MSSKKKNNSRGSEATGVQEAAEEYRAENEEVFIALEVMKLSKIAHEATDRTLRRGGPYRSFP